MTKVNGSQLLKNEEGVMIAETMLLIVAFLALSYYLYDFFSAVHVGIVNQTHARTYLFETLQHRAMPNTLRNEEGSNSFDLRRTSGSNRFHTVSSEKTVNTLRVVASDVQLKAVGDTDSSSEETSQILIKAGYGYCLSPGCGQ